MRTSLRIDILNPKVVKLLNDLAELNLITINKDSKAGFNEMLEKLRFNSKSAPSLEEITKEVEKVRSKRYEK
jgi:hypothetical protein